MNKKTVFVNAANNEVIATLNDELMDYIPKQSTIIHIEKDKIVVDFIVLERDNDQISIDQNTIVRVYKLLRVIKGEFN